MSGFKVFDQTDWMGMAGATKIPLDPVRDVTGNHLEPVVAYNLRIDGLEAMAVVDANGLYVECYTPDGESVAGFAPSSPALGMRWLALLDNHRQNGVFELTTGGMLDAGFVEERIGG